MKALYCVEWGEPETLVYGDLPDPIAGADEVVISVRSIGLNFFDSLLVRGKYQRRPAFPFSPGHEVAGVVDSVGTNVRGIRPGDRVLGAPVANGTAEKVVVGQEQVFKLPDEVDFDRGAGLIASYTTALYALKYRGNAQAGETVAVLGAAGGTGIAACEIGKALGLRVIACASSDTKLSFARDYGAELTVNYSSHDLKDELRRLTDGRGVDLVVDPVGDRFSESALRALAWGGRHLVIGFAAGEIPRIPLNLALLKGCDIRGVSKGGWVKEAPEEVRAASELLIGWVAEKKIKVPVFQAYSLQQTPEALNVLASGRAMGKIIIKVGP